MGVETPYNPLISLGSDGCSPLCCHGGRDSCVCFRAFGPPVCGRCKAVLTAISLIAPARASVDESGLDVLGWFEAGQILEPEAGGLFGIVSELIRLDYLIRLADAGSDTADGVFEGNAPDGRVEEDSDEGKGILGLRSAAGAAASRRSKARTRASSTRGATGLAR